MAEENGTENIGGAAAMREALVQCELFLGNVSRHGHPTLCPGDKCTACDGVGELRGMVVRALSAPARNCDVYKTPEDCMMAFESYVREHKKLGFINPYTEVVKWLLAPVTERKGECDGR